MSRYRIEPLKASHSLESFDCGDEALNRFLIRFALVNQRARASRTYVVLAADGVVGFHTLVVGEVSPEQAPERIGKGLARHPIPLMVLARLAVAVDHQAQGLGAALLKDAIGRTLAAADIATGAATLSQGLSRFRRVSGVCRKASSGSLDTQPNAEL